MAEAAPPTNDANSTQCGYCLRSDTEMVKPKQLSCSHVHCLECLTQAYKINKMVRCPTCRKVYDVSLDSLPSVFIPESSTYCDICKRKKEDKQLAIIYCTSCCKTYCSEHLKFHDALEDDHPKITIDEYRAKARQYKPRTCTEHPVQIYSLSCRRCLTVLCIKCVAGLGTCTNGSPHQLIAIDELVSELQKTLGDLKVELLVKEGELSSLLKKTSNVLSDYERKTNEMINLIHKTRDEQLNAITLAYQELEEHFLKQRTATKSEMTKFLEKELDEKLCSLSNQRMRIEARLKDSHQVDVITKYGETRGEIERLVNEELPKLCLKDVAKLQLKNKLRKTELEIASEAMIHIASGTYPMRSPLSFILMDTIQLDYRDEGDFGSVSQYGGKTYVGLKNTLIGINANLQLNKQLVRYKKGEISGIVVWEDRIYTLVQRNDTNMVYIHDFHGKVIKQWRHRDNFVKELVVVNDLLVVPSISATNTLTVYSLTGGLIRRIPYPYPTDGVVKVCPAGGSHVVVSDYSSSLVYKMNIRTEEVKWTLSSVIVSPSYVINFNEAYILVCSRMDGVHTLHIVDINTGEVWSQTELAMEGFAQDFSISGNTLAVLREEWNNSYLVDLYQVKC